MTVLFFSVFFMGIGVEVVFFLMFMFVLFLGFFIYSIYPLIASYANFWARKVRVVRTVLTNKKPFKVGGVLTLVEYIRESENGDYTNKEVLASYYTGDKEHFYHHINNSKTFKQLKVGDVFLLYLGDYDESPLGIKLDNQ